MKCNNIHCWKLLLDLEGTRHNSMLYILLRLYSYYFIGCPICYIQIPREVRAKLPELQTFEERGGNLHHPYNNSISALNTYNNANFCRVMSRRVAFGLFSSAWSRQMSTVKKTGQRRTSRKLLTSTGHWTQITVFWLSLRLQSQVKLDRQKRRGEIASGALEVVYSGALGPKKVKDLRKIAWSLGLKEEGVKEDYIKAIKGHLNTHPELPDNK